MRALNVLQGLRAWMLWGGTVAPLGLIAASGLVNLPRGAELAGALAVASGWLLKFALVTRAGYQQGFALTHGTTTLRPGWRLWEGASHSAIPNA